MDSSTVAGCFLSPPYSGSASLRSPYDEFLTLLTLPSLYRLYDKVKKVKTCFVNHPEALICLLLLRSWSNRPWIKMTSSLTSLAQGNSTAHERMVAKAPWHLLLRWYSELLTLGVLCLSRLMTSLVIKCFTIAAVVRTWFQFPVIPV